MILALHVYRKKGTMNSEVLQLSLTLHTKNSNGVFYLVSAKQLNWASFFNCTCPNRA